MELDINYSVAAELILDEDKFRHIDYLFKRAGITDIWIPAYFMGYFRSTLNDLKKAREIVIAHGYNTGALNLPVGHPGMSLILYGENGKKIEKKDFIPKNWVKRINYDGSVEDSCADITEQMIKDNVEAVDKLINIGFDRIFFDDDLRLGNYGSTVQGCFCDNCLQDFSKFCQNKKEYRYIIKYTNLKRKEFGELLINLQKKKYNQGKKVIKKKRENKKDKENQKRVENQKEKIKEKIESGEKNHEETVKKDLLDAWCEFQSSKLTNFMQKIYKTAKNKAKIGIMIMAWGDERHGINMKEIKKIDKDILFRIGEINFGDDQFGTPEGKAREILGMNYHLSIVGYKHAYTETTGFPETALSPKNWGRKLLIGVSLGFKHIFLMGGMYFFGDQYWEEIHKTQPLIKKLISKIKDNKPTWPIHILKGDYHDTIIPDTEIIMNGIPVAPIRFSEMAENHYEHYDHTILLILKKHNISYLSIIRENIKAISKYSTIIVNRNNYKIADYLLRAGYSGNIIKIPFLSIRKRVSVIRKILSKRLKINFPFCQNGKNIVLVWYRRDSFLIAINLEEKEKEIKIKIENKEFTKKLNGFEHKIIQLK